MNYLFLFLSSPRDFLIDFRQRGGRERNIDRLPLVRHLARDQTCNLGLCPHRESNPWPFSLQDNTPTKWATLARAWIISCDIDLLLPVKGIIVSMVWVLLKTSMFCVGFLCLHSLLGVWLAVQMQDFMITLHYLSFPVSCFYTFPGSWPLWYPTLIWG